MTVRPITPGLFVSGDRPHLIGGRHRESGAYAFPCPADPDFEPVPLASEGTLWSYTVQRFRPKSPPYAGPEAFEPYAVGYVALPGQLIVEARLTDVSFDALRRDMPMRMTTIAFATDPDGGVVETYAFAPIVENRP